MDELEITIVGGLIVTVIVGLAKLSFRQPKGFMRVYLLLVIPILSVTLMLFGFTAGLSYTSGGQSVALNAPFLRDLFHNFEIASAISVWLSIASLILCALMFLPDIIGKD